MDSNEGPSKKNETGKTQESPPGNELSSESPRPAADDLVPLASWSRSTTRRNAIKSGLVAASMFSALPALGKGLVGLTDSSDKTYRHSTTGRDNSGPKTEVRDFVFDLSFADTSIHDVILVAGGRRKKLKNMTAGRLRKLRRKHPALQFLPRARATHHISISMPAHALQLCYLQRKTKSKQADHESSKTLSDGTWDMLSMFIHTPSNALRTAAAIMDEAYGDESIPVPHKWERLGVSAEDLALVNDPVGVDAFKDSTDTATSMITSHPETACYDPVTSACINASIVNGPEVKPQTAQLTEVIEALGPATPMTNYGGCGSTVVPNPQGYATLVPVCNPDTGEIAKNSYGENQYVPYNNAATDAATGQATVPTIQLVKDDPTLGGNTTAEPEPTAGYIYRTQDGVSTIDQGLAALENGSDFKITTKNFTPSHGYHVTVTDFEEESGLTGLITVNVKNLYVRYLGIYVRYLDGDGNAIPLSALALSDHTRETYFPLLDCCGEWSTEFDQLLNIEGPEYEILGIPVSATTASFQIPMPINAESVLILGSGMGHQSKTENGTFYPTTIPGAVMTGVFNLSLPTLFLALGAASGLAPLSTALSNRQITLTILPLVLQLFAATFDELSFLDPSKFKSLGVQIGETLISKGAQPLVSFIIKYLAEGETEQDLLDAIPVIGGFLALISAIGTITEIAQTSAQVANSPSTYQYKVGFTHDIVVNINPDPADSAGWPATATDFVVLSQFDNTATPQRAPVSLPPGTFSGTQTVTLKNVPVGGKVTISVVVYTATNFQIGYASLGPIKNLDPDAETSLSVNLTIKEFLVPLDETTVYSHKEVIALDANGDHVWNPTTSPPAATATTGCGFTDSQLCKLGGITINSTAGDVGYVFQSFSSAAENCRDPNGPAQMYQFANMSITDNPQSTYFYSGCGFPSSPRVVYDLLNNPDNNYYIDTTSTGLTYRGGIIRQIRLSKGNEGFDGPDSNRAFGKLRFPSDGLLLHPAGQLISINTNLHKIEVLPLPDAATTDDAAPFAQAYGGKGTREGLMLGPTLAALTPDGAIIVLERDNNRIQSFDLNVNAIPRFANQAYFTALREQDTTNFTVNYLDLSIEFKGYIYVLYSLTPRLGSGDKQFILDIYKPNGTFLASTPNFIADKIAVNYWRDIFAGTYDVLTLPNGTAPNVTEPAVSHWIPSTP